MTSSSIALKL